MGSPERSGLSLPHPPPPPALCLLSYSCSGLSLPHPPPPSAHAQSFVQIMRDWRRDQAPTAYRHHPPASYAAAELELVADYTLRLFATTMEYLHAAHARGKGKEGGGGGGGGGAGGSDLTQELRLSTIRSEWQTQHTAYRSHRELTVSLILLSLRMAVHNFMTWWSPRWAASAEGEQALINMNDTVSALFDPAAFHSAFAPLTASGAGGCWGGGRGRGGGRRYGPYRLALIRAPLTVPVFPAPRYRPARASEAAAAGPHRPPHSTLRALPPRPLAGGRCGKHSRTHNA